MKKLALATAALGLAVTATPALAGPAVSQSVSVSTAGLDLASPEGQKMLDKRVKAAAREVCGIEGVTRGSRIKSLNARSCYRKAVAGAKRQTAALIAAGQQRGG